MIGDASVQHLYSWALSVARVVRTLTGMKRLRFAELLRKANRARGYKSSCPDKLKEEISDYYRESNERLGQILAHLDNH